MNCIKLICVDLSPDFFWSYFENFKVVSGENHYYVIQDSHLREMHSECLPSERQELHELYRCIARALFWKELGKFLEKQDNFTVRPATVQIFKERIRKLHQLLTVYLKTKANTAICVLSSQILSAKEALSVTIAELSAICKKTDIFREIGKNTETQQIRAQVWIGTFLSSDPFVRSSRGACQSIWPGESALNLTLFVRFAKVLFLSLFLHSLWLLLLPPLLNILFAVAATTAAEKWQHQW